MCRVSSFYRAGECHGCILKHDSIRPLLDIHESDADDEVEEGQPAKSVK